MHWQARGLSRGCQERLRRRLEGAGKRARSGRCRLQRPLEEEGSVSHFGAAPLTAFIGPPPRGLAPNGRQMLDPGLNIS